MPRLSNFLDYYRKLRSFFGGDYDLLKSLLENNYDTHERFQRREFFRRAFIALSFNGIDGDYTEFGTGVTSFPLAFAESRRANYHCHLWAFDSFQGLPEPQLPEDEHPKWIRGDLKISLEQFRDLCSKSGISNSDYDVVPGYFQDTIGKESSASMPTNISLAYIDCDLYSSTIQVLKFLGTRLKHGMIIAFDDYYCWSKNAVSGERKACKMFFDASNQFSLLPYTQFSWGGMSFIVEDKSLLTR